MRRKFIASTILVFLLFSCKESTTTAETKDNVAKQISHIKENVNYLSKDSTELKGYLSYAESDLPKPAVLVIHEWWGHNDYVRNRADMLADLGYVAFAVDMYGDGKTAEHPSDAGAFAGEVMNNLEIAQNRFDAAMQVLRNHQAVDAEKIAVIGYCFGGSVALTMANLGKDIKAVAAFHSGVQLPVMPTDNIKAKILICNGADDPFVSEESVANYKASMDSLNADYKYIAYPGAQHGFTSKAADSLGQKFNLPLSYQEAADMQSWQELKELLESVF